MHEHSPDFQRAVRLAIAASGLVVSAVLTTTACAAQLPDASCAGKATPHTVEMGDTVSGYARDVAGQNASSVLQNAVQRYILEENNLSEGADLQADTKVLLPRIGSCHT